MARGTVDLVLGVTLGGHLRRVGHAEEDAAGSLQALDRDRIARRPEILPEQGAVGDAPALHPGRVLDGVGHTQDRSVEALLAAAIDGVGRGARLGGIEVDDGGDRLVLRLDAGDGGFRHVARARFAGADGRGDGCRALIQQIGHSFVIPAGAATFQTAARSAAERRFRRSSRRRKGAKQSCWRHGCWKA